VSDALAAGAPVRRAWTPRFVIFLVVLVLATIAMIMVTSGNVAASMAPLAAFLVGYAIWKLPMRYTLLGFIFLGLTLENPLEGFGGGKWGTPLQPLGALLLSNMNQVTHIQAMNFSGADVLIAVMLCLIIYRRATRSTLDQVVSLARPTRIWTLVSLCSLLALWAIGIINGGDFQHSLWQLHQMLMLPIFVFIAGSSLRGPRDNVVLAKLVVVAALYRSILAIYIHRSYFMPSGDPLPYSTSHADSMLFASALAILIAMVFERPSWRRVSIFVLCSPVILFGMASNNRRLVWVELGFVLIAYTFFTRLTPMKRKLKRIALFLAPVALLYVMVGWDNPVGFFSPVRTIRSVMDSKSDSSTLWRDMEDLNLLYTLGEHPILGPGFGHKYNETIILPDISRFFEAYRYHPHNGVLGLWAFHGWLGFSGLWVMLVVGVFLALRSYRATRVADERVAALACVATIIVYINQVYGDIGLGSWSSVFLVGPALAVAGQLATATGAWPRRGMAAAPQAATQLQPIARPHAVPTT
jgi:O-antigen ligase